MMFILKRKRMLFPDGFLREECLWFLLYSQEMTEEWERMGEVFK
jgi:hypothetical protein